MQTYQDLGDHLVEQIDVGHEFVHEDHQLAVEVHVLLGDDQPLVLLDGGAHPAGHHHHRVEVVLKI